MKNICATHILMKTVIDFFPGFLDELKVQKNRIYLKYNYFVKRLLISSLSEDVKSLFMHSILYFVRKIFYGGLPYTKTQYF